MCLSFTLTSMEYHDVISYISLSRMSVSAWNLAWKNSSWYVNYENINNSNLVGMSLASFCQSRAVYIKKYCNHSVYTMTYNYAKNMNEFIWMHILMGLIIHNLRTVLQHWFNFLHNTDPWKVNHGSKYMNMNKKFQSVQIQRSSSIRGRYRRAYTITILLDEKCQFIQNHNPC